MMYRGKRIAFHFGYQFKFNLPGFVIALYAGGQRTVLVECAWSWLPLFVWRLEAWRVGELGCTPGIAIPRQGYPSSLWTGRNMWVHDWSWPFYFEVKRG